MATGEEDINNNILYKSLKEKFPDIFRNVVENGWRICVPLSSSLPESLKIDENLINEHIFQTNCMTLSGKQFILEGNLLRINNITRTVISQETLYTNLDKIHVIYVDSLINAGDVSLTDDLPFTKHLSKKLYVRSLRSVKKLIWDYYMKDREFSRIDEMEKCVSAVAKTIASLEISVQNYVMYHVYKQLMDMVTIIHAKRDVEFNKIRHGLADLEATSLGISSELLFSLTSARHDLNLLESQKTSAGKIRCLKNTVETLCSSSTLQVTADVLVSVFAYLVVKSNVNNWNAQVDFIKNFTFSSTQTGEDSYLLTTIEAAIHWITADYCEFRGQPTISDTNSLFHFAQTGDSQKINSYLQEKLQTMCHPLCCCDNCNAKNFRLVIDALDDSGSSALHYACMCGHSDATQALLSFASTETRDALFRTPLHVAATQGFQTCVLLLCHQNCDLNAKDEDLNSALHLASHNGHESCVKAIVYFAEHARVHLEMNARNRAGDTPLHLAARSGFWNIVRVLLQWKADKTQKNLAGKTASQVAQNLVLSRKIENYSEVSKETRKSTSTKFWNSLQMQFSFSRKLKS